jgi:hypothetical protein
MNPNLLTVIILPFCLTCSPVNGDHPETSARRWGENPYPTIGSIPLPEGYSRVGMDSGTFGRWLWSLPLKKDKTVYLYDGTMKKNQSAQFAVLDIPVGHKDLQQCADAVMRLRAEFLFFSKRFDEICFMDNHKTRYTFGSPRNRKHFEHYLENVFVHCGTLSLEKQLRPVRSLDSIQPGDVLIRGGSPGHAMIVMDMAVSRTTGKKIFLLAQSYMPAQDVHVVINPESVTAGPWYELSEGRITTPEWTFSGKQFRTW